MDGDESIHSPSIKTLCKVGELSITKFKFKRLINYFYSLPTQEDLDRQALQILSYLQRSEDPFVKDLANISNKHLKHKYSLFETFIGYFDHDPALADLASKYPSPQDPGSLVTRFILLIRGPNNKAKYEILNRALICF